MAGFINSLEITLVSTMPIYAVSCFYVWVYDFLKKILGRKNIKK
jgi:molybdopterin biosynthesis enzyme